MCYSWLELIQNPVFAYSTASASTLFEVSKGVPINGILKGPIGHPVQPLSSFVTVQTTLTLI